MTGSFCGKAQPDSDLRLFVLGTNKASEQNELQVEMNVTRFTATLEMKEIPVLSDFSCFYH